MSNYQAEYKCPHCRETSMQSVIDCGHTYPNCVFGWCPHCREYLINETMNEFCKTSARFGCFAERVK